MRNKFNLVENPVANDESKVFIIGLTSSQDKVILKFDKTDYSALEEENSVTYQDEDVKFNLSQESAEIENDINMLPEENTIENEDILLKRKREFEEEALPHFNILRNYACKLSGNEFDADDLVQDTFIRAFRFFDQFEKGTNCKAWLYRIMKNLFINNYKKNQKQPTKIDYDDVENFFENIKSDSLATSDLQEKVFSNLFDDELTHALNSMPDEFKTVVILCDIEELSYEEIADFVKCPVGTIRSRLHRGRKMLHQKLLSYARKKGYEQKSPVFAY